MERLQHQSDCSPAESWVAHLSEIVKLRWLSVRVTGLTDGTALQRELVMDSVAVIALVFRFEETFGVSLSQFDLDIDFSRLRAIDELVQPGRNILRQVKTAGSRSL
jgi:acyl carrier protein